MKKKIIILLCLIVSIQAFTWNSRGHLIIAAIAYSEFSDSQSGQITELLKHHPEYKLNWLRDFEKVSNEIELGQFLFMRASIWADEIGNSENPNFKYHHSKWHYINHRTDFESRHKEIATSNPNEPNVVFASNYAIEMIEDDALDMPTKAIYFAWLIHAISDMHQPLHCTSLYGSSYPEGDKGGNGFFVTVDSKVTNLHSLWDRALGSGNINDVTNIISQSTIIMSKYSSISTNYNVLIFNPINWSLESFYHSVNDVYLNGILNESTTREEALPLTAKYIQNMETLCEKRSYLAGIRLKNAIGEFVLTH